MWLVSNSITQDEILRALNVDPPEPESYSGFLRKLLVGAVGPVPLDWGFINEWEQTAQRAWPTPRARFTENYLSRALVIQTPSAVGHGWQLPTTISRAESKIFRRAVTSARLRKFVDEWLNTAREQNGAEAPRKRDLRKTDRPLREVLRYLEETRITCNPTIEAPDFSVELNFGRRTAYSGDIPDFFESQYVEARRLFLGLMLSEWRHQLCKCRYHLCGRYFILRKLRQQVYRHGTCCCTRHANSATATSLMVALRKEGTEELIKGAGRILSTSKSVGPAWQVDKKLKDNLAAKLNLLIAREEFQYYRDEVAVKWITRHQAQIELARKRFTNEVDPG